MARLEGWRAEGVVEWNGFRKDMVAAFRECHVVCLPSYREGLPKVLIEAAAAGKPVITTDVPGCRDTVLAGRSGLLVPARDPQALMETMRRLIESRETRLLMGKEARDFAVVRFSLEKVVADHLELYRKAANG
jgi:glycosyltransferase involved in cell wall biosynthesis